MDVNSLKLKELPALIVCAVSPTRTKPFELLHKMRSTGVDRILVRADLRTLRVKVGHSGEVALTLYVNYEVILHLVHKPGN